MPIRDTQPITQIDFRSIFSIGWLAFLRLLFILVQIRIVLLLSYVTSISPIRAIHLVLHTHAATLARSLHALISTSYRNRILFYIFLIFLCCASYVLIVSYKHQHNFLRLCKVRSQLFSIQLQVSLIYLIRRFLSTALLLTSLRTHPYYICSYNTEQGLFYPCAEALPLPRPVAKGPCSAGQYMCL